MIDTPGLNIFKALLNTTLLCRSNGPTHPFRYLAKEREILFRDIDLNIKCFHNSFPYRCKNSKEPAKSQDFNDFLLSDANGSLPYKQKFVE